MFVLELCCHDGNFHYLSEFISGRPWIGLAVRGTRDPCPTLFSASWCFISTPGTSATGSALTWSRVRRLTWRGTGTRPPRPLTGWTVRRSPFLSWSWSLRRWTRRPGTCATALWSARIGDARPGRVDTSLTLSFLDSQFRVLSVIFLFS